MTTELERLVIRIFGGKKKALKTLAWLLTVIAVEHVIAACSTHNWLAAFFACTTAWYGWSWHCECKDA